MVVHNEAHRLADTLAAIMPLVDEAVVVDQSSTDESAAIAAGHGATVLTDKHHGFCEPSRQMALDATRSEWVLVVDADESLDPNFADEMRGLDCHRQVRVRIGSRIGGVQYGVGQPIYRLFRRQDFYCKPQIHSCPLPRDPIGLSSIFVYPGVALWDNKTWVEAVYGWRSYRALGRTDLALLDKVEQLKIKPARLDRMTPERIAALGLGPAA